MTNGAGAGHRMAAEEALENLIARKEEEIRHLKDLQGYLLSAKEKVPYTEDVDQALWNLFVKTPR